MNHQFNSRLMLAIFISLSFAACKGKGGEKGTTPDSTKTTVATDSSSNMGDMDATKVAPGLYKTVADSLGIRIVDVNYKPGDSSAMHWHPDYALYTVEGGTATFYGKDGSKMDNEMKTGATNIRPGEYHSVKNTGKTNIHVVLVEVTRSGAVTAPDPASDATKVSPELYQLKNDTLGMRVIEVNYKPGQSSKVHWHPDAALYVIDGGTSEFTAKDGTKRVMDLKSGMAVITPSETHSVKNVGKTTVKAILVEVYRAMK